MNEMPGSTFRVLLATDDSDAAQNAEAWVSRGRWPLPCVVDVLCVARHAITRLGWGMQTYRDAVHHAVEQLRESEMLAAERIANEVSLRIQDAGLTTRAWARQGDAAEEILATIVLERPALVALGQRGRSSLAELLLGSVSRQVIGETEQPVLVARKPPKGQGSLPQTMLVLVDGRPSAEATIDWLEGSGWVDGTRITVLGLLGVAPGLQQDDPELVSQVTGPLREDAVTALDRLAERLTGLGAEVDVEIDAGHPRESALRVAERLEPDVIVVARPVGRRRHDPFAEKVARYARTSVLIVPQP